MKFIHCKDYWWFYWRKQGPNYYRLLNVNWQAGQVTYTNERQSYRFVFPW